jgi:hypothetical protein
MMLYEGMKARVSLARMRENGVGAQEKKREETNQWNAVCSHAFGMQRFL